MPVQVMVDGMPVTLDTKLWSWDVNMNPIAPNSYLGSDLHDPVEVFRTQPSVRTVVGFLSRNIAQVALHSFTLDADGDRRRMPSNRTLPRLLDAPSATATPFEYMRQLVVDLCLFDRYASRIVVGPAGRLELRRIPPNLWHFERNSDHSPRRVNVWNDTRREWVPVDLGELVWFDGFPLDKETSPLIALYELLVEQRESSKFRRQLWEGSARFPGYITRPADAPNWRNRPAANPNAKSGAERFREEWAKWSSTGAKAGTTPILEDGMTYHETQGITPEDAQQLESRKFSIAEVAAAYHVPPVFVGLLDNANYSNVTAYRNILYSDTLGPWFTEIQQGFNARLLPHPLVYGTDSAFVEFNVAAKLRLSFDEQARIFQTATGGPIMTRNEARRRLNLPAIEGADELIVPLNVTEGGQASPTDSGSQNER